MSLRTRLLLLFIILALIPLGIAGNHIIRIAQDEMKSSVNDALIAVTREITRDFENYRSIAMAPLVLIRQTLEGGELNNPQIIQSLLTEGMKASPGVIALKISVQGGYAPMIVMQDQFTRQLTPMQLFQAQSGHITHLKTADLWVLTIILALDQNVFGYPATLTAAVNLKPLQKKIKDHIFTAKGGIITLIDADGRQIFKSAVSQEHNKLVLIAKKALTQKNRGISTGTYTRPNGEKMLDAYAFPTDMQVAVIVEQRVTDAYLVITQMLKSLAMWILIGLAVSAVTAVVVSISLTRPLINLTGAASVIAAGDLSVQIETRGRKDEIGQLSEAFNIMVTDLRGYITKLTAATKARERAEHELKLARTIQQSFLPTRFPDLKEIDTWGQCNPAREVGGDYFDFFNIDADQYGMVIGDVSGKGVAAALFMAVSRSLFRILSTAHHSPAQVLTEFNTRLVELDQGSNMFITMFYGVINIKSGRLLYSTAGHNMPFICHNSSFQVLADMKTMVAGMMEDIELENAETILKKDDTIVLFTDGISEANNIKGELYGEDRLEKILNQYQDLSAREMGEQVIERVNKYQSGTPQFDDMTMFILKFK